ncbi:MAG: hypothetical protein JRI54_12850 [Deltaproteobacteria bacterium]|nr:hypothetical protein [Deltaproteobacteria bacterium]
MTDMIDKYLASAIKGIEWSLSILNADGSFHGSETTVTGHYKAPQTLATGGYMREAEQITAYIGSHFFSEGDFHCGPEEPAVPFYTNYKNAWLCWGAQTLGAYDLSSPGGDFLERAQNQKTGCLAEKCSENADEQTAEWGGTACGIVALLAMGRIKIAVKAGEGLIQMLDSQPKPSTHFYLRQNWAGEWITDCPEVLASMFRVEYEKPAQTYWYFGIGMAAFGKLYLATGDSNWLEAGNRVFDLAAKMAPESYQSLTSAKIGWGCATMYRCTGEKKFKDVAIQVADMLVETQTDEGVWLRTPQFDSVEKQPITASLDTTLERCNWLFEIIKGLQRG